MKRIITTAMAAAALGMVTMTGAAQAAPVTPQSDPLPHFCSVESDGRGFFIGCDEMPYDISVRANAVCENEDGDRRQESTGWIYLPAGTYLSEAHHCDYDEVVVKVSGESRPA